MLADEFPRGEDEASEGEEEQEARALRRLAGELGQRFEADARALQAVQVSAFVFRNLNENETKAICFMPWFLLNISKEMCILELNSL